ncbi:MULTISPECIES: rod shape-determining protein MreD [Maritimibacter]|jgi:rod shape-determining protein MreD|uniref:rod shape-determining protein MreD n=1 Tax=Maritimibacter TaxID=404235 RepID=UPI0011097609|nr:MULTISPECIES: rod shape-determining protein MreD [Maritimibacter]MBL6426948.1 rod shape-determining protein MreD [Maritimibacter sp.]
MIDPYLARRLLYMLLFLGISALILFTRMLPLHNGAQNFPPPDLILCFAFAWTVRRPDYLPVLLVAAILLVGDMLSLAPPGIAPLLAILGLEALRSRRGLLAEQGFALEWVSVGAILTLMMLAERLILGVFFVPQVGFGMSVLNLLVTVVAYPVAVLISSLGFRIEWLKPGALDPEARPA